MTKYILHGGETKIPNETNKAFYREWVKDFKNDFVPTILLVYFSRPREEWEELEKQDRERFAQHNNNLPVNFIVSNTDLKVFQEQVKKADVIYVRGGSSDKLMEILLPIKDNLLNMFNGKIFAGSSAGVMFLSNFTRSDKSNWKKGFGLLPFNAFVHYSERFSEELASFKTNHPEEKLEYLLIPETEFIIKNY